MGLGSSTRAPHSSQCHTSTVRLLVVRTIGWWQVLHFTGDASGNAKSPKRDAQPRRRFGQPQRQIQLDKDYATISILSIVGNRDANLSPAAGATGNDDAAAFVVRAGHLRVDAAG